MPTTHGLRFSSRWLLLCFCLLLTTCFTRRASAQLPAFELQSLSQSIAQIDSSFELTLTGSRSDELQSLLFSAPQVTAEQAFESPGLQSAQPVGTGKFKVHIAPSAETGPCEVRGLGRFGLSNPRRLWLTRQPVVVNTSDHSYSAAAVELKSGTILFARCQPQKRNYYRLHVPAGQTLRLAAYAQQLDSRATPIVVLQRSAAHELARGRVTGPWPAEMEYHAAEDVDLVVIIHDAIFQGGLEYAYALECHMGSDTTPAAVLELDQLLRPTLSGSSAHSANIERVVVSADAQVSDSPVEPAQLPVHITSTFSADRTPRIHEFEATRDQQLTIAISSHSAGQLTDPRVVLYRLIPAAAASVATDNTAATEVQQQLVEQDDPAAVGDAGVRVNLRDPHLTWTVPEDGRYRLEIQDNESGLRQPTQKQYTLDIRPARPHFHLLAYPAFPTNQPALSRPSETNLLQGGTTAIRVVALRREGFNAPIEVSVTGLPASVKALPVTIHPAQSEATLTLACQETAEAWSGPIEVIGVAATDSTAPQAARPATIVWPAIPTHNAVQSRLCEGLMLCVNSLDTAPLSVVLGSDTLLEVKQGEKLTIPVSVTRRSGGGAACVLRPQNLLPKVTAPELAIAADQTAGACELTVAADAPLGEFSLWLQTETKVKWRENPQALQRAEAQLAQLNTTLAEATEAAKKTSLEEAIKLITTRNESLKTATAEKELTVFFPTTTQRVRVIAK